MNPQYPGGYGPPGGAPPGGYPPGGYGPPGGGPPGYPPPGGMVPAQPGYPPGPGAPPGGGGNKGLVIALILGGLIILAGGATAAYLLLGGSSKSVAREHLPSGCDLVGRLDVAGALAVPAVRKHVVPALEQAAIDSKDAGKGAKFLVQAHLNPEKDLKEVAFCVNGLERAAGAALGLTPDFVVIVGGNLNKGKILDAIAKDDAEKDFHAPAKQDGLLVMESKKKPRVFLAQADDGAFLIGSSVDMLKKANPTSASYKDYNLPMDNQLSVIITASAMARLAGLASMAGSPVQLGSAGRAQLSSNLDPGKVGLHLELGDAKAASETAGQLKLILDQGKQQAASRVPPLLKPTLDGLAITTDGKELRVDAPISNDAIEEGARKVAEGIKKGAEKQ